MTLSQKNVLITGASSGIGEACARLFAKKGANVALVARRLERLEAIGQEIQKEGGKVFIKATDVSKKNQVEEMVAEIMREWGQIDLLINNAGVGCIGKVASIDEEFARRVFDTNFFGAFYFIQAVIPHMKRKGQGHIINVSSVIGKRSIPQIGFYCATKFALNAMSDSLRIEIRKDNIHVTTVCPGYTETEFSENQIRPEKAKPMRAKFRGQTAEKVAQAIYKAALKKPREVHLTFGGKFLVKMERLSPWIVDQMMKMTESFYGSSER